MPRLYLKWRLHSKTWWTIVERLNREAYVRPAANCPFCESLGTDEEAHRLETEEWTRRGKKVNVSEYDIPLAKGDTTHWIDAKGDHGFPFQYLSWDALRKLRKLVEDAEYEKARRRREGRELWVKYFTAIAATLGEKKKYGGGEISNATVNRELYALRRAFNLAKEATPPKVGFVPKFRMLPEDNIRKGFLEYEQYRTLLEALPEELRVPFVIAYHTGSRRSEVLGIRLDQIDLHDSEIRLYDTKKHKEGRWLPIYGEMGPAIAAQLEMTKRDYPKCPWLIHREGEKVVEMRPAWPDACEKVGLTGLLFHDLRRSAVRNMVRAGIPEAVAMKVSGHKTRAVFDRYNIIDGKDIKDAGKKLEEFLKRQA